MARAITVGKDGLIEGVRPSSITADCSTISPAVSIEIGAAFAAKGRALSGCSLHRIESRRREGAR